MSVRAEVSRALAAVLGGTSLLEGVKGLESDPSAWDALARCAHHHLLAARLHRLLLESDLIARVPQSFAESLALGAYSAASVGAVQQSLLPPLLGELERAGFGPVPLKGWSLARRYYERPDERVYHDVDLLFDRAARRDVEAFFVRKGYRCRPDTHRFAANADKTELVAPPGQPLAIELHFGLGYDDYDFEGSWSRARRETIDGAPVRVLDPIDEYLYLVFHCAVQHRFQKLGWVVDLAEIRRRSAVGALVPSELGREARARGFGPAFDMSEYFLVRFAGLEGGSRIDRRLDRWFSRIANASVERSFVDKARLRALAHGGWIKALGYAVRRQKALAREE